MANKKLSKVPHGLGSFQELPSGNVRLLKVHTFPDGFTKQRLSVTRTTQKKCIEAMAEIEAELDREFKRGMIDDTLGKELLPDAMLNWLITERKDKIKQASYDRIERTIKNQISGYAIGTMLVGEITKSDLINHLNTLAEQYSYSVLCKAYDALHQFFFYFNPTDNQMIGVEKPARNAHGDITDEDEDLFGNSYMADMVLSDEEIKIFKEFVYHPPMVGVKGRTKYGLLYYFTMMTFLRSGEIRALKWKDVDLRHKRMQITKTVSRVVDRTDNEKKSEVIITTPKTTRGRRIVMLTDEALEAIRTYKSMTDLTDPDDFVFATDAGKPISEGQASRTLKAVLQAAGLMRDPHMIAKIKKKNWRSEKDERFLNAPERKGFAMHYLRHSGISYYLRHGVPIDVISKMAGHASTSITQKIYYHINLSQEIDALSMMNNL